MDEQKFLDTILKFAVATNYQTNLQISSTGFTYVFDSTIYSSVMHAASFHFGKGTLQLDEFLLFNADYAWDNVKKKVLKDKHGLFTALKGLSAQLTNNNAIGHVIAIKCECGSESVGSSRHSAWCHKFEP